MKRLIAISQRVTFIKDYSEKRDSLDQRWVDLFLQCDFIPLLLPNSLHAVRLLLDHFKVDGFLLTGGSSLTEYGGDTPERDEMEMFCLDYVMNREIPLLGICRGMQVIQHYFGLKLVPVAGHVAQEHLITINQEKIRVNSFHTIGVKDSTDELEVLALADDGCIEAIRHRNKLIRGIMWHPERNNPYHDDDIQFLVDFFN